jgi:hypothetical protein
MLTNVLVPAEQARVLLAFLEAFDLHTTGVWAVVAAAMKEEHGVDDPEEALEAARRTLRGE